MGDEFRWNIAGVGVLPANFQDTTTYPLGFKLEGGLGLEYEPVFLEGGLEGSLHDVDASPLGVDHYDLTPPFNFTLSGGLAIRDSFYLRLGRHHYEKTEVEGLLTNRAYSVAANFANIVPDLGIFGGEALYHIDNDEGTLRELKTNVAYLKSKDRSHFGILEGLVTLGLEDHSEAPTLTLAAYGTVQPEAEATSFKSQPGLVHGQGIGAALEYGMFSGVFGFTHRYGGFQGSAVEERSAVTLALMLAPDNFLFRGAYSWITQSTTADSEANPPIAISENHLEFSAGYYPSESFLLSMGYRGVHGQYYASNQVFLGLQTAFSGAVPFTK
ncbi:MAG TPA: hypothetical protein VJR29_03430 [bacterium]|nr:hypothetical protein [bacterium]